MRIAIVEPLQESRQLLANCVQERLANYHEALVLHEYTTGEAFWQCFRNESYQIVLLCVELPDVSGLEIAARIRQLNEGCQLIITGTQAMQAVESYKVQACYYLLKPLTRDLVQQAIGRCMEPLLWHKRFIHVVANRQSLHLPLHSILSLETRGNAVVLHTIQGPLVSYRTFGATMALLADDIRFLECYHGCAVNMDYVKQIVDCDFVLIDGSRVPIRRKKLAAITQAYQHYCFQKNRLP